MGHGRFFPLLLAAAAVLLLPHPASAIPPGRRPPPVRLSWVRGEGAEGCPAVGQITRDIHARLGFEAFSGDAGRSLEAVITRTADVWTARLFLRDDGGALQGTRTLTLEGERCAAVMPSLLLAVLLAIDPNQPPPPPPPPPVRPQAPGIPHLPAHGRGMVSLGALFNAFVLPAPAFGAAMRAEWFLTRWFTMGARLEYLPPVQAEGASFAFGQASLSLGGCALAPLHRWLRVGACVDLWAGLLRPELVRAASVEEAVPGNRARAGAAFTGRLDLTLYANLVASLEVGAVLPFWRLDFGVPDAATNRIFLTEVAGLRSTLGLGLHF